MKNSYLIKEQRKWIGCAVINFMEMVLGGWEGAAEGWGLGGWGGGAKGGRKENGTENLSLYYIHFGVPFPHF